MIARWVVVFIIAATSTAAAFPTGSQFDLDPVMSSGAGGIAFTGAPRWSGHTCAACHTDAPGIVGIRIESNPAELFTTGWKASTQYHMRVVMTNETEGLAYKSKGDSCGFNVDPYSPCDQNGFALEMDDPDGKPTGTFAPVVSGACASSGTIPPDIDVRILTDGTAVTHNGAHFAMSSWDFCWTAPAAGAGTITAYVAAVDGNGGNGTQDFPNDTTGDDVASGAVPIAEAGTTPPSQGGGCNAGGDAGGLVIVVVAWLVRRRRMLASLALVSSLAACTTVRPRQRETLAKKNMKFAPDPTEDELDLHMQESREGSAGGYGSAGGGCGCN